MIDSHYDFSPQPWSRQIVASKVWDFFSPCPFWQSVWLSLTANVQTSVSSPCSDAGLQYGTTHFRDDKDSWLCFPPLCESNVTIRTQLWQATCPRAYVAFSVFKKPKGSSVAFWKISVASLPPLSHLGPVKVAHSTDVYSERWRQQGRLEDN